jgi:hypothetical protein
MGKSRKKARESHRQGRGRRASHFADEDGDVLPSSAYDGPPCQCHQDGSSDEDDTNEAAAEDEQEGEAEAGDQDLRQAGSMPSKFQLYQLSVQVTRVAPIVACICGNYRAHHLFDDIPMRVMCLCLVTKGGHQLPAEVLPDVCGWTCSSPPARGFLWHSPSQVKSLSKISFKKSLSVITIVLSPLYHFHELIVCYVHVFYCHLRKNARIFVFMCIHYKLFYIYIVLIVTFLRILINMLKCR